VKKALFHLHTHHSYDCLTTPKAHVLQAVKHGIDLIIIADHDSLLGSLEAREYAKNLGLELQVPLAAEYLTDAGDIIAIGIPEDFVKVQDPVELCRSVKSVGGYTVLPHPYDAHNLEAIDFSLIDAIEVFNSRSSAENNQKSLKLAESRRLPKVYGSDAHFLKDALNTIFSYQDDFFLFKNIISQKELPTPKWKKAASQAIKGIKNKDLLLFLRSVKKIATVRG